MNPSIDPQQRQHVTHEAVESRVTPSPRHNFSESVWKLCSPCSVCETVCVCVCWRSEVNQLLRSHRHPCTENTFLCWAAGKNAPDPRRVRVQRVETEDVTHLQLLIHRCDRLSQRGSISGHTDTDTHTDSAGRSVDRISTQTQQTAAEEKTRGGPPALRSRTRKKLRIQSVESVLQRLVPIEYIS